MYRRLFPMLALVSVLAVGCGSGSSVQPSAPAAKLGGDWTRFGYDAARHNAGPSRTGITSANVRKLKKHRVVLDGTVDASPIYLRGVTVRGSRHDTFFVTTSYGRTVAIDAATGREAKVRHHAPPSDLARSIAVATSDAGCSPARYVSTNASV